MNTNYRGKQYPEHKVIVADGKMEFVPPVKPLLLGDDIIDQHFNRGKLSWDSANRRMVGSWPGKHYFTTPIKDS